VRFGATEEMALKERNVEGEDLGVGTNGETQWGAVGGLRKPITRIIDAYSLSPDLADRNS